MKQGILCLAVFVSLGLPASADMKTYGDITLSPSFSATGFSDIFDLTKGDVVLRYTIDMRGITQTGSGVTSYTEVGLRQAGAGNFNPGPFNTYQGGAGGWMTSLVGNVAPTPGTLGGQDKHNLSASGGRGEGDYDATTPSTIVGPSGGPNNHGIWFDRDTVDPWQATYWGAVDGGTYNTGGVYDIEILYHAIDPTLGTMFATVNGVQTGFYTGGWHNGVPDLYPMGLSFRGDMTQMQAFAGLWAMDGAGGDVYVKDLRVGTVPEPSSFVLFGTLMAFAGAGYRRFARRH